MEVKMKEITVGLTVVNDIGDWGEPKGHFYKVIKISKKFINLKPEQGGLVKYHSNDNTLFWKRFNKS